MAIRNVPITEENSKRIPNFDAIREAGETLSDNGLADALLIYRNDTNGLYAVYYNELNCGQVISLAQHFESVMGLIDTEDGFTDTIRNMYAREAGSKGFPKFWKDIKPIATWRDILGALAGLDGIRNDFSLDDEATYERVLKNGTKVSIPLCAPSEDDIENSLTQKWTYGEEDRKHYGIRIIIEENS